MADQVVNLKKQIKELTIANKKLAQSAGTSIKSLKEQATQLSIANSRFEAATKALMKYAGVNDKSASTSIKLSQAYEKKINTLKQLLGFSREFQIH